MTLAQKLQNARLSHKISQKTLAEALGVSRSTISVWECGLAVPQVQHLRKYQDIFGFEHGYFDDAEPSVKVPDKITFDTSQLCDKEVSALEDFYHSLLKEKEY